MTQEEARNSNFGLEIKLTIRGQEFNLTIDEARALHEQLSKLMVQPVIMPFKADSGVRDTFNSYLFLD